MTHVIKIAKTEDISGILSLRYQSTENKLRTEVTYEMIQRCLTTHCRAWVAISDDAVIGFSLANKKLKMIWGLFVLPSYQGLGIGKALLQEATLWLQHNAKDMFLYPCKKIWLNTEIDGRAEKFYQHLGWEKGKAVSETEVRYWYTFQKQR